MARKEVMERENQTMDPRFRGGDEKNVGGRTRRRRRQSQTMDPRFRGGDEKNTGGREEHGVTRRTRRDEKNTGDDGMITDGDASFTVRGRVSGMILVPAANQAG
jgi:hypothetical protein